MKKDNLHYRHILYLALILWSVFAIQQTSAIAETSLEIEVSEYEKVMEAGVTRELIVTLNPKDSEETIHYHSSNKKVATISQSGRITAKTKGKTNIIITAGNAKKTLPLTVKIPASGIAINSDYAVIRAGQTFQIRAKVSPLKANQKLSFRSTEPTIAAVTKHGKIIAKHEGSTSVLVSNGDITKIITVVVNRRTSSAITVSGGREAVKKNRSSLATQIIDSTAKNFSIAPDYYMTIVKQDLQALYETEKNLKLNYENYSILISGNNIVNYANAFYSGLAMEESDDGITFNVNRGKNMPGAIKLAFNYKTMPEKPHIYLYNQSKNKYEKIRLRIKANTLEVNEAGQYLIADKELNSLHVSTGMVVIVVCILFLLVCIYIVLKRKYWFW